MIKSILPRTISVFALYLLIVVPFLSPKEAQAQVVIQKRPFAVHSDTLLQNIDGWFDVSEGNQKIGVFVENTGGSTLYNVQGTISFPPGSNISPVTATCFFGNLVPGIPVFGVFEAFFGSSSPNKYDLILDLTGDDDYSQTLSRKIFVAESEVISPTEFSVTVPEGTITTEIISLYEGQRLECLGAPTRMKLTMIPSTPFSGRFSNIPFNDPWWKVAFGAVAVISSHLALADVIVEYCSGDFIDNGFREIMVYTAVAAAINFQFDVKDLFRVGEENTNPQPDHFTVQEEVEVFISYDADPAAHEAFTGTVSWNFIRYTTGHMYPYSVVDEPFINDLHSTMDRQVSMRFEGSNLIATLRIKDYGGQTITGSDAYAVAMLSRQTGPTQKQFLSSTIMRDDGKGADTSAMDGTYTASIPGAGGADLILDVMAQDVNGAAADDPPLVAATKIGGLLISHSSPLGETRDSCQLCGERVPSNIPALPRWKEISAVLLVFGCALLLLAKTRPKPRNSR